jgi:hypothetical protein
MAPVPLKQSSYKRAWRTDRARKLSTPDEYEKQAYILLCHLLRSGRFQQWLASFDNRITGYRPVSLGQTAAAQGISGQVFVAEVHVGHISDIQKLA